MEVGFMKINEVICNKRHRETYPACPTDFDLTFIGTDRTTRDCSNGYPYKKGEYGDCNSCKVSNSKFWGKRER
jgi:hypothetical protein